MSFDQYARALVRPAKDSQAGVAREPDVEVSLDVKVAGWDQVDVTDNESFVTFIVGDQEREFLGRRIPEMRQQAFADRPIDLNLNAHCHAPSARRRASDIAKS